jgi:TonB-linked SusC/RagA family outer membrane protein
VLQTRLVRVIPILTTLVLAVAGTAHSQAGQIRGTVTNQETAQPLGAVQVYLEGTSRANITRADGTYVLTDVPPGTYTMVAQIIGYQQTRRQNVQVGPGATVTVNFQLPPTVLALQEVVATGLIDPTEGVRSPITVSQVNRETFPVIPAGQATAMLSATVPGVNMASVGGQPGQAQPINLRTPTSARQDNTPMIIVDGVILGVEMGATSVDIESMDIETIEVIKGAAAASLYGSRAAAGVISITTNRGRSLAAGTTRFQLRSEAGYSSPADFSTLPSSHAYLMDAARTTYVDRNGNPVDRNGRVWPADLREAFLDKPYPTPIYNNLNTIYRPGDFNTQNFSISSNMQHTNFVASFNRYFEKGAMEGNNGYVRRTARLNLDHRFLNALTMGVSISHARAERDNLISASGGGHGGLFHDVLIIPPDVDINARDPVTGWYLQKPDPQVNFENTIWRQYSRSNVSRRARTLGNANMRWNPSSWFTGSVDVSFDREDAASRTYVPRGTPTSVVNELAEAGGNMNRDSGLADTFNGSVQASVRRDFGDLNARTTLRGLTEWASSQSFGVSSSNFNAYGVEGISATRSTSTSSSQAETIGHGFLWDTALDYDGKYIGTVLLRRDGSSRFGPQNRWHTYYRTAFAYRLAEEPWFNVPHVDELKLRYARGTAGGRPSTSAQYETWTVSGTGITKGTLGNADLSPEHTTEQEFGLDLILFNRLSVELVHARQTTTNQLISAPVPAITGYNTQWINSGAISGKTTELRVESRVVNRPNFSWSTTVVGDRSSSVVTDWPQPCVTDFISLTCEGSNIRDIWLNPWVRRADELPSNLRPFADQFQRNDDGFLVWVGQGNTWRDGIAKNLWKETAELGGETVNWGIPILQRDDDGTYPLRMVGTGQPIFQGGWANNVRWGNASLHAHLAMSVGNDIHNMTRHYLYSWHRQPDMEQAGKSDDVKKPVFYYHTLYADARYTDAWLEDASYLRLRALQGTYRLTEERLGKLGLDRLGLSSMTVGLIGRDLWTLTNYSGFDPGGVMFSRMIPFDYYNYPTTATYTASIEVNF